MNGTNPNTETVENYLKCIIYFTLYISSVVATFENKKNIILGVEVRAQHLKYLPCMELT